MIDTAWLASHLVSTLVYAFVGIAVFGAAFWLMVRLTPFSVRKEIEDDQNMALAVVMGSVILGLAIIIAATISG